MSHSPHVDWYYQLQEGLTMTVLQLIILAVAVGSFAIGRYSGYHDGYVKGRIAVRKYYESLQQVSR
jgi:hypothetical protein